MKTYREISIVCLLLATGGVFAQSGKTADRKEIEGDYARSCKAMKQKDIKPLFALMTKDATFKERNGKITSRSELEAMMKQMFTMLTYTEITPKATKWAWQNSAALVDMTTKSAGKMKTPDGKTHAVTYVSKSRDTWVKQADGWRLQQIEAVSETMTVDDKPVVMPVPPANK